MGTDDSTEVDMPYRSEAQRKFFQANKEKLAKQGVDVNEWDKASKGKELPERIHPPSEDRELVKNVNKKMN